jgi:ATP-binding cassette subfamily F protein uup
MARAPLLQLSDISLTFGGDPLFEGLSLAVQEGDRIALVGRNGSGKSTLMKIMAGLVEPDRGLRATAPGTRVGYMEQDPDLSGFATLGDYARGHAAPGARTTASSWRPRAGLASTRPRHRHRLRGREPPRRPARLMPRRPTLLLDEPTNHLDIAAIPGGGRSCRDGAAFVLISHDRAVLRNLTEPPLGRRGEVRRQDRGFTDFEAGATSLGGEDTAPQARPLIRPRPMGRGGHLRPRASATWAAYAPLIPPAGAAATRSAARDRGACHESGPNLRPPRHPGQGPVRRPSQA